MSSGNIVTIIVAVVDVNFPRDSVHKNYDALTVQDVRLKLEFKHNMVDFEVSCIAMG